MLVHAAKHFLQPRLTSLSPPSAQTASNQSHRFVSNLLTAFPGCVPLSGDAQSGGSVAGSNAKGSLGGPPKLKRHKSGLSEQGAPFAQGPGTAVVGASQCHDEEEEMDIASDAPAPAHGGQSVRPRFRGAQLQGQIAHLVETAVKEALQKISPNDTGRAKSVQKALVQFVAYERVRNLIAGGEMFAAQFPNLKQQSPLEGWLNNPSMVRQMRELLPRLASCCVLDTDMEKETMANIMLIKSKLNTQPLLLEGTSTPPKPRTAPPRIRPAR
jgi:hypothetical protein